MTKALGRPNYPQFYALSEYKYFFNYLSKFQFFGRGGKFYSLVYNFFHIQEILFTPANRSKILYNLFLNSTTMQKKNNFPETQVFTLAELRIWYLKNITYVILSTHYIAVSLQVTLSTFESIVYGSVLYIRYTHRRTRLNFTLNSNFISVFSFMFWLKWKKVNLYCLYVWKPSNQETNEQAYVPFLVYSHVTLLCLYVWKPSKQERN